MIAPKFKSLGYECFFMEYPEGKTSNDFITCRQAYAKELGDRILKIKSWADTGVIPKDAFYKSKQLLNEYASYLSILESIDGVNNISSVNLNFKAIDVNIAEDFSIFDNSLTTDAGMKKRDIHMASAYLTAAQPVFGLIGFKHALGVQNEILSKLSLQDAQNKFCFVHIYSEPPIDVDDADLQANKINYPLGITIINSNEISEDQIMGLILRNIYSQSDSLNSSVSNLSFFKSQEMCNAPTQDATDCQTINNTSECMEFQPDGSGYDF